MGGGGGSKETTTRVEFSPEQRRVLNQTFPIFQQYLQQPTKGWQGPNIAPLSGATKAGWANQLQSANQVAATNPALVNAWMGQLGSTDVTRNPYLQSAMAAAVRPTFDRLGQTQQAGFDTISRQLLPALGDYSRQRTGQLTSNVIPTLSTGVTPGGGFGSPKYNAIVGQEVQGLRDDISSQERQARAEIGGIGSRIGSSYYDAIRAGMDATSQMGSDAYKAGLDATGRAILGAPLISGQIQLPGQIQAGVGQSMWNYGQQALDANRAQFWQNYMLPLQLAQGIQGSTLGIPSGTNVAQQGGGGGDRWGSAAQGALGGAAAGSMGGFGYGTAIGAILGGLGGYMSGGQ